MYREHEFVGDLERCRVVEVLVLRHVGEGGQAEHHLVDGAAGYGGVRCKRESRFIWNYFFRESSDLIDFGWTKHLKLSNNNDGFNQMMA